MKVSLANLRNPSPVLVSHGAWSAVNVLVQFSAYLLLPKAGFALVSLGILAGSQGGQIARAAALEAGLGSNGVGGTHMRLALAVSIAAGLLLSGAVTLALDLSATEGLVILISSIGVGLYDTARNVELLSKRYKRTRRSDLVWLFVTGALLAVAVAIEGSPLLFLAAWMVGALAGLATLSLSDLLKQEDEVAVSWSRVLTFGGDYLSVAGATQVFTLAAAATSGVSVIATLRLAQLVLAPVNFVITGVRSVLYQSLGTTRQDIARARKLLLLGLVIGVVGILLPFAIRSVFVSALLILTAQRVGVLAGLLSSGVMRKFERLSGLRWLRLASVLALAISWATTKGDDADVLALCLLLSSVVFLLGSVVSMKSIEPKPGG